MKTRARPHLLTVGPFWLALSILLLAIAPAFAANWPGWRGPDGAGVSPEKSIPTGWSATENVRGKIPLPDRGNSTPAVWGDKVFVTQAIYTVNASGIADCIELKTGKTVWTERVKGAGPKSDTWSSAVLAGDRIYHLNQSGDCVVFRASPKFELIGANSVGNEMCNASLAVSDGDLFIRTHKQLWCIAEPRKTASVK